MFGLKKYFANFYQLFTKMFVLNPIFGVLALKIISENLQNIVARNANLFAFAFPATKY